MLWQGAGTLALRDVLRYRQKRLWLWKEITLQDREDLKRQLTALETEHRDLDDIIERIAEAVPFNHLQLQRMKKRKLVLKDQMARLRNLLLPDIIA
jgi:hypothetical protein